MANNYTVNGVSLFNNLVTRGETSVLPAGQYTGNNSMLLGGYPVGSYTDINNVNKYGSLGNNTSISPTTSIPSFVGQPGSWVSASAGVGTSMGIDATGALWAWGVNNYGQLGLGDTTNRSSPVQVGALTDWVKVVAGPYNTMAIKSNGTLWAWGANTSGQLGDGTLANKSSPVQIGSSTTWVDVSPGDSATLAVQADGTLWGWGFNGNSVITDVIPDGSTISSPVRIGPMPGWSTVSIGGTSTTITSAGAIKPDGTLWTWGINTGGALGNGTSATIPRSSPTQVGSLTDWSKIAVNATGVSGQTMYSIKTDGTLWAWGVGTSGQLGDGTIVSKSSPIQVGNLTNWDKVYGSGNGAAYAIKTDGTLWSWGQNTSFGALGDGTVASKSSPVQIGSLTTWAKVSGMSSAAIALKTDGTLWSWGLNTSGQLGDGTRTPRSSPAQVGSLTTWADIAGAGASAYGIKTDGTLWAWGLGTTGQLGDGTILSKSSPIQVGSLTDWSKVEATHSNDTVYALKTDGTMWAWGLGTNGQLGDGTILSKSSPIQVGSLTDWTNMSAGGATVLSIKSDGTMYAWGAGASGQLGNFTSAASANLPIQTATLQKWTSVNITRETSHGIKADGTLWGWGDNSLITLGLIGDNTIVNKSSPVQIGTLTDWKSLSGFVFENGDASLVALKTTGTMWTWGGNSGGQLGVTPQTNRSSPSQVGSFTDWVSASMGANMLLAVRSNGTLWASNTTWVGTSTPVQISTTSTWASVAAGGTYYSSPYYIGLTKS